jgi:hypothetical protein
MTNIFNSMIVNKQHEYAILSQHTIYPLGEKGGGGQVELKHFGKRHVSKWKQNKK